MGGGDIGCLRAGFFQLHDAHRHPIAVQHHVKPASVVPPDKRYLVDGEEVIVELLCADDPQGGGVLGALSIEVSDAVGLDVHLMDAVALGERMWRPPYSGRRTGALKTLVRRRRTRATQSGPQPRAGGAA